MGPLTLAAIAALGPAAAAAETEVGFILRPEVAVDTARERPAEDTVEGRTTLRAWARGDAGAGRWFLEVRGAHTLLVGLDPAEASAVEADWEARPGESGFEGPVGPGRVRAGLLVERWGRLDLLSVVDVLNPRDLRSGPLVAPELAREPVPMVRGQWGGARARGELVLLPFASADEASFLGTDWSLIRQGVLEAFAADAATWEGDPLTESTMQEAAAALGQAVAGLDPSLRRGLDDALGEQGLPQALLANGEVAARFEVEGAGADAALMAGALRSHTPLAAMDPTLAALLESETLPGITDTDALLGAAAAPLETTWPRTWMAGAEASTTLGRFGLRAEGRWLSTAALRTAWLGAATSPSVAGAVGVDTTAGSWLVVGVEARWEHLLDPPEDLLLAAADDVAVGGTAALSLLGQRLAVRAGGVYDVAFREHLLRAEARWRLSDAVEVGVGGLALGGPTPPPGTLPEVFTYTGGPLSFWGDNDCVTATLAWIR